MIRIIRKFSKFTIDPKDIVTRLSYGSGPGGQSVNKSENCVNMIHVPTGLWVKVHQSRDLEVNKHIAIKRLTEKVEHKMMGSESKISKRIEKIKKNKARRKKKYESKHLNQSQNIESDSQSSSEGE
jgi:protein subunit release factor B